jgi:hypothetical protein
MSEHQEYNEHPELLLAGADRPRPLSAGLRARLEDALSGTVADAQDHSARPLSAEVRDRLETSLRPAPVVAPARASRWVRWKMATGAAAAAAVVVLAAVVVPGALHGGRTGTGPVAVGLRAQPTVAPGGHSPHRLVRQPNSPSRPPLPSGKAKLPAPTSTSVPRAVPKAVNPDFGKPVRDAPAAMAAGAVLSGLSPSQGPAEGGNWVIVSGQGLAAVKAVYFGSVAAPRVSDISALQVKAQVPAHVPGTVEVHVLTRSGYARRATPAAIRYDYQRP